MIKKYFSWTYVKSHPIMFGGIVVVFGLILLLLLNKKAPASTSSTVTSGTSDAQAAIAAQMGMAQLGAQTQVQLATIDANTNLAKIAADKASQDAANAIAAEVNHDNNATAINLAGLSAQIQAAQIGSQERVADKSLDTQLQSMALQMQNALEMQKDNNSFQLDYAQTTYNAAIEQAKVNASLTATLGAQQLDAYKTGIDANVKLTTQQQILSVIPTLKSKDRDEALEILGGNITGNPVSFVNGPGPALINVMTYH